MGINELKHNADETLRLKAQSRQESLESFVAQLNSLCRWYGVALIGAERGIDVIPASIERPSELKVSGNPWYDNNCYLAEEF
jgi:hypothetical protein